MSNNLLSIILEGNVEHKLQQTDQLEILVHGPGKELKSRHLKQCCSDTSGTIKHSLTLVETNSFKILSISLVCHPILFKFLGFIGNFNSSLLRKT